nr:prolipoprotein diacylglyceryl transferase [Candidatus Cloacimonadota bacterium]
WIYRKVKVEGLVFWAFIGGYGIFRFILEYFRQPDDIELYNNGLILKLFTMGQILSLAMVLFSLLFTIYLFKKRD